MTMALRVPTFANCSGPSVAGTLIPRMSSSGARTCRFGPVKNSPTGIARRPRSDSATTTASPASSTGCASPAGDAEPRLPATVAR